MSRLSLLSRLGHAICYFVPAIFGPLLKWVFGISDDSRPLREFRTVFTVAIVKAIFNDPTPVSMLEQQQASLVEVPPESSMWISQDTLSVPLNHNLSEVLRKSAVALANQKVEIPEASAEPVDGEWVGHRNKSHKDRQDEQVFLSNEQAYARLAKDTNQEVVMIYLHGGQFYLRNPASRRRLVHALTERTGGRCFSMAYRLSPQNTFPCAVMDLLVVYLSLLYPLAGSRHKAVSPFNICICGDSSGGSIAIAFLQLLLEFRRQGPIGEVQVNWNGANVPLPLPAAICSHSGYLDLTRSLPSEMNNLGFDIIPSPALPPAPASLFVPDSLWPSTPRRHHVYAPTNILTHPLVSPVTAWNWKNCSTKVWLSVGQECLSDGNVLLAKTMAKQGVDVALEIFEGMPHDFLVLLQPSTCGQECTASWAAFVKTSTAHIQEVEHPVTEPGPVAVRSVNGDRQILSLERLGPHMTREELIAGMEAKIKDWGQP